MKLAKNGNSIQMGFLIRRKSDGLEVGDVANFVPIAKIDDPNAWWVYGVNAYLHLHKLPTHMDERLKYTATPTADYGTRHAFLNREFQKRLQAPKPKRRRKIKPAFPDGHCPTCGYLDPQLEYGVNCPNCDLPAN